MRSKRRVRQLTRLAGAQRTGLVQVLRIAGLPVAMKANGGVITDVLPGQLSTDLERTKPLRAEHEGADRRARPIIPRAAVEARSAEQRIAPKHRARRDMVGGIPRSRLSYVDEATVLSIHDALVQDYAADEDPIEPGVRDSGRPLSSALMRPHTSLGSDMKYPTLPMAGALLHALVHNHPFHDGNKRTATVSLIVFLDMNGFVLTADDDELFDYILRLAKHETTGASAADGLADSEMLEASRWLQRQTRVATHRDRFLRFRDLKRILTDYGFKCEVRSGNRLHVERGSVERTITGYRNENMELTPARLRDIRTQLELDEEHGVDSSAFYDGARRVPEFVSRYRRVLDRLAPL